MSPSANDLPEHLVARDLAFFSALTTASLEALDAILADDFILVDLSGARSTKSQFLGLLTGGQLTFLSIVPQEPAQARLMGRAGIVWGRTMMRVHVSGVEVAADSRYTHVYVEESGTWRLAAAQGTPVQPA
jgi:hypothetical protein